jgi:YggT family protein
MFGDRIMIVLMNAVNTFFQIVIYLILGRAILSWFVRNPYGSLYKVYSAIIQLTEPILSPCRKLLARFGMGGTIDFSPILAIIGLTMINGIVINILRMLMF